MRYGTPFSPQMEQAAERATIASGVVVVVFMGIATLIVGLLGGNKTERASRP